MSKLISYIHLHLVILWAMIKVGCLLALNDLRRALEGVCFVALLVVHKIFLTLPVRSWRAFRACLWRIGFMIAMGTRYYKNWSHTYQFLYERKWQSMPIDTYATLADLQKVIATCTWTADGLKELGDAFSSAGYIQHVISLGGTRPIGDCDEFAMYNSTAIRTSIDKGIWKDRAIKDTFIMTVGWLDKVTGKYNGHNVCAIEWADGKYSYVDYYAPSNEADTLHDVALQVIANHGGLECVGWAVQGRDLSILNLGWR